ncbi:MAG: hypothetical protein J0L69_05410 [Bacteroidetes bacterium]|nr:hypothetical protein [Bacteroidota bacterium]
MEEKKLIKYSLKAIEDIKFNFQQPKIPVKEGELVKVNYTITPNVKFSVKESIILVRINVIGTVSNTNETVLDTENLFVFGIENLNEYLETNEKSKEYKFKNPNDEGILITFVSISTSTMRGIIFSKTTGTLLQINPLPIVNPSGFFKKKSD